MGCEVVSCSLWVVSLSVVVCEFVVCGLASWVLPVCWLWVGHLRVVKLPVASVQVSHL